MSFYAVIDTNVLVSALLSSHSDAATVQVVREIYLGNVIPLYSDATMAEYREVLRRKKFHFSPDTVAALLRVIERYGISVSPSPSADILPDLKDLPFYEVVMEKRKDHAFLVTGNIKHFPERFYIVTAREFLEIMESAGSGAVRHSAPPP